MSFVDVTISKRHFRARYLNVGRALIAQLADIACVDVETATAWADEIDREDEIAAGVTPSRPDSIAGGGEGPSASPGA